MLETFLAVMHFDGSRFVGWQRQRTGRSVQGEVERVLERFAGRRVPAHAAGRTDAGVHATGLGVSFSLPGEWTARTLRRALNALLPPDCWVQDVFRMRPGFHARKSAVARRYRYTIGTDEASASPFRRPFEWALGRSLALDRLEGAAVLIRGEHDFRAFSAKNAARRHPRCRVAVAEWTPRPEGRGVSFTIEADRFLHHMVRMLVGTMVDIALDRRPPADMAALLARGDNRETSPPAPPQGLYFVAATYPPEWYAEAEAVPRAEPALLGEEVSG